MNWDRFGPKLANARKHAGLTLGQAARVTGYDKDHLKALEAGEARPTSEEFDKLRETYDVHAEWLLSLPPYDL